MTSIRLTLTALTLGLLWGAAPAMAQGNGPDPLCVTPAEVIISPHDHLFGVPTVWDATYGEDDAMVQLVAGLPLEKGTVLAWGRTLSKDDFKPKETLLVELNRRGRTMTLKKNAARTAELPTDLIGVGKGYVASSTIRGGQNNARRRIRLSWYNADADYRFEKILQDDTFNYDSYGLLPAIDGNGFVAIIHAVNRSDERDQNGLLMRFTAGGELVWKRAYRPGIPNMLRGLMPLPDGNYIAIGRIRMDNGIMAGWVLKLGPDGTIIWQRAYERGNYAVLNTGALSPNKAPDSHNILLLGDARPVDGGPDAVWLMEIDTLGEIIRQRYLRHKDFEFTSFGLSAVPDGRLTLAVNARVDEDAEPGPDMRDHIRLFTMSSQGVMMTDEAYVEGIEGIGRDYFPGWNGERIVVATVQSDSRPIPAAQELAAALLTDNADPANALPPPGADDIDHEGWVFVATALDPYINPCMPSALSPTAPPQYGE